MTATAQRLLRPTEINAPSGFGGGGVCPPDTSLKSRQYISPLFSFIILPGSAQAQVDVLVTLPIAARCIFVASCLESINNNSLFLHFNPLNHAISGGITIAPNGTEQWMQLCGFGSGGGTGRMGSGIIFEDPLPVGQPLYFDIGNESGGAGGPISILVTNSLRYWKLTGVAG